MRLLLLLLLLAAAPVAAQTLPSPCPAGEIRTVAPACLPMRDALLAPGGTLYWVDQRHPAASDRNPGTEARPWRTIGRATGATVLRPGDAVVVRSGLYREEVTPRAGGQPDRFVTYAAFPGDTVVVSGADVVPGGWWRDGEAWRLAYTTSLRAYGEREFRRELLVADGEVLRPVYARTDVVPGTFWVDGPDNAPRGLVFRLPGDRAPADAVIELGVRHPLFFPYTDNAYVDCGDSSQPGYLRVVGFRFRHAVNRAQWGAVCAGHRGSVFAYNQVTWTNGVGIDASGQGHTFVGNTSSFNGQMGFKADCDDCLFDANVANGNNWKGHNLYWESGGGKWTRSERTRILRFHAQGNQGPGLWLDIENRDNVIACSVLIDNEGAGLMLELNTTGTLVYNNLLTGTRWAAWSGTGLLIQAASHNWIVGNTLASNAGTGLWLRNDPDGRAPTLGNQVWNNLLLHNAATPEGDAREVAVSAPTLAAARTHVFDGNAYHRHPSSMAVSTFYFSPDAASPANFRDADLARWQSLTGSDAHAIVAALPVLDLRTAPFPEQWGTAPLGYGTALPPALRARIDALGGCPK